MEDIIANLEWETEVVGMVMNGEILEMVNGDEVFEE